MVTFMQGISGLYSELGRITDMTAGNPVEYRISARAGFRLIFYHAYFNRDQQASLLENANILLLIQKKFKNVYFFKIFFITEKNKLISGQTGHPVSSFPEHPLSKLSSCSTGTYPLDRLQSYSYRINSSPTWRPREDPASLQFAH